MKDKDKPKNKKIPVMEVFGPTMQGEGLMSGTITHFIRTGGCGLHCTWCIAKGVPVLLPDFSEIPIQDVMVGDKVMGLQDGKLQAVEVTATHDNGRKEVGQLIPTGLICTPEHKILNMRHRQYWQQAQTLNESAAIKHIATPITGTRINNEFKRGWLAGYFRGDGNFHKYKNRWWRFKVTSNDDILLTTAQKYAAEFGFVLRNIIHNAGRGAAIPHNKINGLECTKNQETQDLYEFLYTDVDSYNFARGWLAGIYDAEGTLDGQSVRIAQIKTPVRQEIIDFGKLVGFNVNEQEKCFILTPSPDFFSLCPPVLKRKIPDVQGVRRIRSKQPEGFKLLSGLKQVYDLTTTSGNYVAGGVIVHNCDTMWAVDPKKVRKGRKMMTVEDIVNSLRYMPYAPYVTLTGGDPCLHDKLGELIVAINAMGARVAVETQGQLFPEWLEAVDVITFSPKPPSSGNIVDPMDMIHWIQEKFPNYHMRRVRICIKIVVFNLDDWEYALEILKKVPVTFYDAFYVTAGTPVHGNHVLVEDMKEEERDNYVRQKMTGVISNYRNLANTVVDKAGEVDFNEKFHIGCQLHSLIWADKDKGA